MKLLKHLILSLCLGLASVLASQAYANGPIGDHVNDLQAHLKDYAEEVEWMIDQVSTMVDTYEKQGAEAAKPERVVDFWEEVKFHSAIETNYVPVYASIWQGLFGVRMAIENKEPIANVRKQLANLEQALWQGLGAVKLAAQFQQKGLLAKVENTEGPTTPVETLEEIKHRLDRVVAKYAERLTEEATSIVHDTYLTRFEGVEGALIEQDADLVEDLEKDFNVTLPLAIQDNASVDKVRAVVVAMQAKLDRAKSLLAEAEKNRKDVF